jgi:uncharacterized protein YhaN
MRLSSLTLHRYGNFNSETIAFDPRPGVVNIIVAPNGAGKSILRGAFCDLLFGIGGQTPMSFRFGYAGMRLMAEAVSSDNIPIKFGRRKQGNLLINGDDEPLDPAMLVQWAGPADRKPLEHLFALDTDRLRQGEADLFSSNGALADALMSGAGEARQARQLRVALDQARDSLAPKRKSSQRPFYLALDRFNTARDRLRHALVRPEQWEKRQEELDAAEQHQRGQHEKAAGAAIELARLERIRRVMPDIAKLDAAMEWLAAHPDAPVLDAATLKPSLDRIRTDIILAEEPLRRERERAARLAEQIHGATIDGALLARAEEIDEVTDRIGAVRKVMADLPGRAAELSSKRNRMAELLGDLGDMHTVDQVAAAVPPRAAIASARRLMTIHSARLADIRKLPSQIAALERDLAEHRERMAALPRVDDRTGLRKLTQEIRAEGDPALLHRQAVDLAFAKGSAAQAALARVPGWSGAAPALQDRAPFQREAYERIEADLADARLRLAEALQRCDTARADHEAARQRHADMVQGGELADENALHKARARRDTGWALVYRRAFTADAPSAAEEQDFAGPLPLPSAFERAVLAADAVADRRVADAQLIERAASLHQAETEAARRLHDAEQAHRIAAERVSAAERTWAQTVETLPLGAAPTLREVESFIQLRQQALDAVAEQRLAEHGLAELEQRQDGMARLLSEALNLPPGAPLSELLPVADHRIDVGQKSTETRAALEARIEDTAKALATHRTRLREAEAAMETWRVDWAAALSALGRPAGEDPEVTQDLLQVVQDLDTVRREAASLAERVDGMSRDNDAFAAMAAGIAARVAPDLSDSDPLRTAEELRQRLRTAREQEKQFLVLREQLAGAEAASDEAERELHRQQTELRAVLQLIGSGTVDDAEARLVLAAERARHAASQAEAEQRLRETGDGRTVDQLRAELATIPPEAIALRIGQVRGEAGEALAAAQEAAGHVAALRHRMELEETDTAAGDAAADQQAAAATIGRVLDEAIVLHAAGAMLEQALVQLENTSGSEVLRRISELFQALTTGAYTRIVAEPDADGTARLTLLQRDHPNERQSVRDLSEGTRDQLFLALRLASIEQHVIKAPPLPFIGDDILQTFDDGRALATLRVLGEVSRKVQVILLTHHRHLLDLAKALPPESVHVRTLGEAA